MQLAEQTDHLTLAGRFITETAVSLFPEIMNSTRAIHQADDAISHRGEAEVSSRCMVLHDIPQLAPVNMPVHFALAAQAWFEIRDPIPGRAEQTLRHHVLLTVCRTIQAETKIWPDLKLPVH